MTGHRSLRKRDREAGKRLPSTPQVCSEEPPRDGQRPSEEAPQPQPYFFVIADPDGETSHQGAPNEVLPWPVMAPALTSET